MGGASSKVARDWCRVIGAPEQMRFVDCKLATAFFVRGILMTSSSKHPKPIRVKSHGPDRRKRLAY